MKKNLNNLFICSIILIFICLFISGCAKKPFINNESVVSPVPNPTPIIEVANTIIDNLEPQIVNEHGNCSFTAKCSKNLQGTWYFISPDWDAQFTIEDINSYAKDLRIVINGNTIYLINIPRGLSGWMIYCEYPDGLVTIPAIITVNYEEDWTFDPYANKEF